MEFVFVVPRRELFGECYPQGFHPFGEALSEESLERAVSRHGFFVERDYAERNPELKQVIPYCVVERDGEILLLRRLKAGGEARLHDRLSIGVGGHINPEDLDHAPANALERNPIEPGSRREIREEIDIDGDYTLQRVGLLNDDSNPVGAVHVGVVQLVRTTGPVEIREKGMLEGGFVPPAELQRLLGENANFETWSAELVRNLGELLPEHRQEPLPRPLAPQS